MLVRLHSSTRLLSLVPNRSFDPPTDAHPVHATEIACLTSAETEGRRHADVALDHETWSRALIVDESGGLWLWGEERVEVQERIVSKHRL